MQLDFLEHLLNIPPLDDRVSNAGVLIGQSRLPIELVRNRRAKRYIVRLLANLVLRVTIPRGGSKKEALRFVSENLIWIEKQYQSHRPSISDFPPTYVSSSNHCTSPSHSHRI